MAWNEPGGGKDPWGGNRSNEGPPDIDEAIKKLKETFSAFGGGGSGSGSGSGAGGSGKSLLPIGLLVIAIIWGLLGVYQVDEKEQALVLRLGKYHDTLNAGLKWNPPLIDKVIIVRVTEERQYSARGLMLKQKL